MAGSSANASYRAHTRSRNGSYESPTPPDRRLADQERLPASGNLGLSFPVRQVNGQQMNRRPADPESPGSRGVPWLWAEEASFCGSPIPGAESPQPGQELLRAQL